MRCAVGQGVSHWLGLQGRQTCARAPVQTLTRLPSQPQPWLQVLTPAVLQTEPALVRGWQQRLQQQGLLSSSSSCVPRQQLHTLQGWLRSWVMQVHCQSGWGALG